MPNITMTVPDTYTTRVAKVNRDVTVTVPENVIRFWIEYGRKQELNDGHSSIKRDGYGTEREWHAAVDAYVAKWRVQRESGITPANRGAADLSAEEWAVIAKMRADAKKKAA